MLTHPKWTTRVLRMLIHLCAGHVTLLRKKFQSLKIFPQSDYKRRANSRWALSQISSFYWYNSRKKTDDTEMSRQPTWRAI